jgi:putative spermidine/putrescine transport system substrate-binding protein
MNRSMLGLLAAMATMIATATADELTVISFPRADQAALKKAYLDPFQKSSGVEIKSMSYDGETDELEAMVNAGKTTWDLMQVETRTLQMGCEQGLFEKLDYRKIGNKNDFVPGAVSECGVGIFTWSMALGYDADKVNGTPATWADFWDVKKYPGMRALRRSAKYTLEIALLADGVAPADVYKVLGTKDGVDRAFNKLDQIRPNTVWWEAAAQAPTWLAAGKVVMSSGYTMWMDREQKRKNNVKIAWDENLYDVDSWAIPKGTPNAGDVYKLIAYSVKPDRQKALSEAIAYGPTNKAAVASLGAKAASNLPSSPANIKHALRVDLTFWIHNGDALEDRFEKWAPPICRQQIEEDDNDPAFVHCDNGGAPIIK